MAESRHAASVTTMTAAPVLGAIIVIASFFLSWNLVRVQSVNLSLSTALYCVAAVFLLFSTRLRMAVFGRFTAFWILGFGLLIGGLLIGSAVNGAVTRWTLVSAQYFMALLILPAVLVSMSEKVLHRAILAFIFGVALSQLLGVITIQFLSYDQLASIFGRTFLLGNGRLGAMTGEPNSNGAQCAFAIILLVHATLGRRLPAYIALPTGAVILAGMVASASVTSFIACTAGLAILLAFTSFGVIAKVILPAGVLVFAYVALGGPIPSIFVDRVAGAAMNADISQAGTFTGRVILIDEAWRLADDYLLVGMGVDRFREVSSHGAPVHNLYLLLLNEGGIMSLAGLLALIMTLFAATFDTMRRHRLNGAACLSMTVILIVYTMSIPHMYDRIWLGSVLIMFAYAMSPIANWLHSYAVPPYYTSRARGAGAGAPV